jgi:aldose 1-epimerase
MTPPPDFGSVQLLDPERFRGELDGRAVGLYVLRNPNGMLAGITNYGAKIEQLIVPDRDGRLADVVLGYDSLEGARNGAFAIGAFVGRYAGRIENATFVLDGRRYQLTANNGPHCLHGGVRGSPFRVFDAVQRDSSSVEMNHVFADGEEGFPGRLALRVTYSLTDANELVVDYSATALDQPTVASVTTHAFFNLNGHASGDILGHEVAIFADRYFEMTADLIATGAILPVQESVMDLSRPVALRERIKGSATAKAQGQLDGYDDCFLLRDAASDSPMLAARVTALQSGRSMEVWSTEPALQFYTGVLPGAPMAGGVKGKEGRAYLQQQGFCMEPQGYPNAPNRPVFRSARLEPGQTRSGTTLYRFGTLPRTV